MAALTGKEKRKLRSTGQKLDASTAVGKGGLSQGVFRAVGDLLDRRELIKVRLPAAAASDRRRMGQQLAAAVGAEVAGTVGRMVLLYRPNDRLDVEERILAR